MDIKAYNNHCVAQEAVTEQLPFDQKQLVYYVVGKRLALADIDICQSIHLQCDPATALRLREGYVVPFPGHHINKNRWNTVRTTGRMPDRQMLSMDRW